MSPEIQINEKLILKIPTLEDAVSIYEAIDTDREHLKEFLVWVDKTESVKDTENNIIKRIEQFQKKREYLIYYILRKQTYRISWIYKYRWK